MNLDDKTLLERQLGIEELKAKKHLWENIVANKGITTDDEYGLIFDMMDQALGDLIFSEAGLLSAESVKGILPWQERMERILLDKKVKLIDNRLLDAVFAYIEKILGWRSL